MSHDPDQIKFEQDVCSKDPSIAIAAVEAIEVHLRYGIASLKLVGWIVVLLLTLILWRIW